MKELLPSPEGGVKGEGEDCRTTFRPFEDALRRLLGGVPIVMFGVSSQ